MNLVVRTSGDPLAVASAVRHAVHEVDREIMVMSANTLDDLVSAVVATPRFRTVAMTALALLALGMTCLGLGGAIAYSVAQRTAEIAVRMTLGAKPVSRTRARVARVAVRDRCRRDPWAPGGVGLYAVLAQHAVRGGADRSVCPSSRPGRSFSSSRSPPPACRRDALHPSTR